MKQLLYALGILLIGMGGGLVAEETLIQHPYIGWWIFGIGVLLIVLLIISESVRRGYNKIWGGRNEEWRATSSYRNGSISAKADPQRALSKDIRDEWRSPRPQELGASFKVDMVKERMIEGIQFEPDEYWVEKPRKWQLMFFGRSHETLGDKIGEGFISVKCDDIPKRIQYFEVHIREVAEDMPEGSNYANLYGTKVYWTISLIRIKEYRFSIFGKRFWLHEI